MLGKGGVEILVQLARRVVGHIQQADIGVGEAGAAQQQGGDDLAGRERHDGFLVCVQ
ncbi:hypothetical protein D3C84_1108920 [compost metagenome]